MSILKRIKISRQVGLISLLALIGFAAVAGVFVYGSYVRDSIVAIRSQSVNSKFVIGEIRYALLDARRHEKNFLADGAEKSIQSHAEIVGGLAPKIAKLRKLNNRPETVAKIDRIEAGLSSYANAFTAVAETRRALGIAEDDGLRGALRNSAQVVEERVQALDQPRLFESMLMMRHHEKDFLALLDPKYIEFIEDTHGQFTTCLAEASIPAAEKDTVAADMAAYQAAFREFAVLRIETEAGAAQLDEIFAETNPIIVSLVQEVMDRFTKARKAASAAIKNTFWAVLAGIAVISVIVLVLGGLIGRAISQPIIRMTQAMARLAHKDMEVEIPGTERKDEIGEMAEAVQVFKDNMIEADRLAAEQKRQQEQQLARATRLETLCKSFDATSSEAVRSVAAAASQMQASSSTMNATAVEATRQSAAVAAASEEASANVQTVASAAEELSSSISEISRQVTHASEVARAAVEEAEETNAKVLGLADAANKIGEVVALITDIAEQTNLLALNATIEAARAGDAGKGFAVVASEVKNLANQTAKATDEIGTQIADIQSATKDAVQAIGVITKTISEIDEVASGIASAVEEQGAATQEIARNVEQASAGTQEVSSNISGVSQAANETGSAATEIQSAAGELSQQSERLRTEVDKFLSEVRAA